MYNAPRAATCKAVGKVKLWGVDRNTFKVILMDTTMKKRSLYKDFLSKVPILANVFSAVTTPAALLARSAVRPLLLRRASLPPPFRDFDFLLPSWPL